MNRHTRFRSYFIMVAFLISAALCASADILKIKIDGPIHAITEEHVQRAIDLATQQNADALLIEIRTPGGLADATHNIVEKILSSPVPVVVYVAPSGARSASAGFYILEAADIAAMAPGTNTGSAHPVSMYGNIQGDMRAKVENDFAAWIRSYVPKRGRNVEIAETAVRESKSWSDQEALSQKLIDVVATDQNDLFKQLDGRTIKRFDGNSTTLHLAGKKVDELPYSLRQKILGWMMDPNITFFILAIGAMALYAEFNHPGAIIPGVVGLIFIVLAIFALNLLPTRFAALALILAAFVLFALEAKYASHGVLGVGGIVALTLGGLLLVDGPIPEMRVKLWTALGVSIPLGIITIFLMTIALRARQNKVTTGSQGLIGETGTARTPLNPEGKVFVHGEIWNARSNTIVQPGEAIVVRSVNGLHLVVEPVTAGNRHDNLVRA
jgi:membrane-bound serine protease (ClpP class)